MGKSEIKRPLGRSRRRLEDNIKMNVIGIKWGVMNWIFLAQDMHQWRVAGSCKHETEANSFKS
jgi:hypothetical protein